MHRVQLKMQISDLTDEINRYNAQNEADLKQLRELRHGVGAYERIARERYFMQADNEDIYVLSDDEKPVTNNNEATD